MRYIYQIILLFCFCFPAFAQMEEDPMEREKSFRALRQYEDGTVPEVWEAFTKIRKNNAQGTRSIPLAHWESLGPDGLDSLNGRMTCMAINPVNTNHIIAGSASGGIWKSINGGDSWFSLSDDLPSLRISCIAINPSDTNHILVGTGFFFFNDVTPGIGILESQDGGKTWIENSFQYPVNNIVSVSKIIFDPKDNRYVFMASNNGVWLSDDTGKTWLKTLNGTFSDLDINPADPAVVYASYHKNGIYKSIDHGKNWTKLGNGLPTSVHRITVDVSKSHPNILFAAIVNPNDFSFTGLYKSRNAGATWAKMSNVPEHMCVSIACQGWFVNQFAVSPVDTNYLFLGGHRFFVSSNGGQNWQQKDYYTAPQSGPFTGITYVDIFDIGFDPSKPEIVYTLGDGGVFKSFNHGKFWHKKNHGLSTSLIYQISSCAADSTKMIMGTQDLGLYYLDHTNGNLRWKMWMLGDGADVAYDPNNPKLVYGDALFGDHRKNANIAEGVGFTTKFNTGITGSNSTPFHFVLTHHPVESKVLYTANDTKIFKTTDGLSWKSIANIANVQSMAISPVDPETVYAYSYLSNASVHNFYRSTDGGKTWFTAMSPGWRVTDLEADPVNYGVIYATRNSSNPGNAHLYKSTDHGNTWISIKNDLPDVPTSCVTVNPYDNKTLYVGTDLGVFISEDGGDSWTEYNDNLPPYYVTDMHFHKQDTTLRIATWGRGVWKTKSNPNHTTAIVEDKLQNLSIQVYPNPFNDELLIKAEELTKIKEINVLNQLGQRVSKVSHVTNQQDPIIIATHKWQPGLYFVELKSQHNKRLIKVVKI